MGFAFRGLSLNRIAVIGSGQIGPDIALHFSKTFHVHNVPIIVVDVDAGALERGAEKLKKKVAKGVETGAFRPEAADAMVAAVTFTGDYDQVRGADLVVEAATEDLPLKRKIFAQLESLCPPTAVFASNSSHLEPERIFDGLTHRGRALVIHYFFPAERNLLVEIVPGKETDPTLADNLRAVYEEIGKVPIRVGSRYGYAIDPIFEGVFLAAALCVEKGWGTTKEVDSVSCRALGLRVGTFTAMNLAGGNPIAAHGLEEMHERLAPWFHAPELLKRQLAAGAPWVVPGRGEEVALEESEEAPIRDALRGAYFGLAGHAIDSGITNVSDLEMAVELGLDMTPPFTLMNRVGISESLALVRKYAKQHAGFPVPACLVRQAEAGKDWQVDYIQRRDANGVAVLTIRRPRVLNALSREVYQQLQRHLEAIRADATVRAAVLTGFGNKAFVSGADVRLVAEITSPEMGIRTCESVKAITNLIQDLGKPVVCALNGFAFGGGLELAMCCSARLCRKGLKVLAGLPEVNLGFIPGAGGTQRLPRLIGLEKAATLLRTGRTVSSWEAVGLGLVHEEVEGDLVAAAARLAREMADGKVTPKPMPLGPLQVPESLPAIELGHLSRKIDAFLCRAILEGCRKPLSEGLRFESEMFGECCRTEDMTIGVANFLKNGPKVRAEFKNA